MTIMSNFFDFIRKKNTNANQSDPVTIKDDTTSAPVSGSAGAYNGIGATPSGGTPYNGIGATPSGGTPYSGIGETPSGGTPYGGIGTTPSGNTPYSGIGESSVTKDARSEERRVGKECRSRWS